MSLRRKGSLVEPKRGAQARLGLLGGFELRAHDRPVRAPLHVQRLLAFLALQGGRPLHRAHVAGRLWIDLSQEHAHACLRTTLWRLSRVGCPTVEVTSTHLALASDVTVDVHELEASAARILHGGVPAASQELDLLTHAAELLPDWYPEWVLHERERVHQLRLVALETAADELIGVRRYSEAGRAALAAVGSDPLRESAQRLLIRSYLGEGNGAEALRHFEVFCTELQRVYGLQPSPQMQELIREVGGMHR